MDVLFLDANVLFSAAWRVDAGVRRLWELPEVELLSSDYAVEEARLNLAGGPRRDRLESLLEDVRIVTGFEARPLPPDVELPEKDRPILLAALGCGATHLLTGDVTHFGDYFGRRIETVTILPPGRYLAKATDSGS